MNEVTQAKIVNAGLAIRRRPVLALLVGLGTMLGTSLLIAGVLNETEHQRDCYAYADRAMQRRHLNDEQRREVARSCGVSVIYGPLEDRAQAQNMAETLNASAKRTCANPGAYVAHWFDDRRWAAFCPQM